MENQYIRLINRNHPLPPDYIPKYLVCDVYQYVVLYIS